MRPTAGEGVGVRVGVPERVLDKEGVAVREGVIDEVDGGVSVTLEEDVMEAEAELLLVQLE